MYTHILLDMDGTLLDFRAAERAAFRLLLARYGIPFREELYSAYEEINNGLWRQLEQGLISGRELQARRFALFFRDAGIRADGLAANDDYLSILSTQAQLIPHAREVCARLCQSRVLAIVTNGIERTQRGRLAASGLAPYIRESIVSERIGAVKPAAAFFDKALDILGRPDRRGILVVGDSLASDMQGALNAGLDRCWFNPGKAPADPAVPVTYEIDDLRQLITIADNCQAAVYEAK